MCSEAIAGDLRDLRSLIKLSSSEAVGGPTQCLIPGPRPDQRSMAAAPMAGCSTPSGESELSQHRRHTSSVDGDSDSPQLPLRDAAILPYSSATDYNRK